MGATKGRNIRGHCNSYFIQRLRNAQVQIAQIPFIFHLDIPCKNTLHLYTGVTGSFLLVHRPRPERCRTFRRQSFWCLVHHGDRFKIRRRRILSDPLLEFFQERNNRKTIGLQLWTNEFVSGLFTFLGESDQLVKLSNCVSSKNQQRV
jgi:hypothetical protein